MAEDDGRTLSGAQAIVACLEAEDAKGIFGYPGGQVLDIFDALYASKKLHLILTRHEQAATHAADGYARATGKPGVVVVTSGPGATNTVTGIANAYMDSVPLIVITGQVNTTVIGTDAFQESDITGITLPIVKHSYLVKDASELPRIMKEAFHIATTGRPGPVLIDVPANIAKAKLSFSYPETIQMATYKPTYQGNKRQVKQAVTLISEAKRPVIYAGGGIISSGAEAKLRGLAELMDIPVVTTLMGKGCFPETHPLYCGMSGMHGMKYANRTVMGSDLVIAAGVRFADRVTGRAERFAPNAKIIHIDIDPAEIGKNRKADVPIVGDVGNVLTALIAELQKTDAAPDDAAWLEQIASWKSQFALPHPTSRTKILPSMFLDALQEALSGRDAIISTEVGQHQMWAAQYLTVTHGRDFLSSGGLGAMGFGFPAAIGAQVAYPGRPVVCIAGDGSFQMNIQEMATAVVNRLPVKIVIFDNTCLGMVRQYQQFFYGGRYSSTLLCDCLDYEKLADAYGWQGRRIDAPDDIVSSIDWLLACEGPALLDVRIPRAELAMPMLTPDGSLDQQVDEGKRSKPIRGKEG